jgi:hypothetical protein
MSFSDSPTYALVRCEEDTLKSVACTSPATATERGVCDDYGRRKAAGNPAHSPLAKWLLCVTV